MVLKDLRGALELWQVTTTPLRVEQKGATMS